MLKKAAVISSNGIGRWARCQRSGLEADPRPCFRRTDLSLHASNGPREGTSHILFPPSRRLRRPAAQESGGSIAGCYEPMGTKPFNRSRGRLAAGKASDRSGVVVRHTTTSRVLGGWILRYRVGSRDLLLKERLSYRLMIRTDGPDAADPVGRPTSGRKLGKLPPESPWQGGVDV